MLKKTVVYEDFDGNSVSEDLYFNLTRMELIELNNRFGKDDMEKYIDEIVKAKDVTALYSILKDTVLLSYGVKSEDGKRFIKNDTVRQEFEQSLAFAQLIEDFHEKETAMNDFMVGITKSIKGLDINKAVNAG